MGCLNDLTSLCHQRWGEEQTYIIHHPHCALALLCYAKMRIKWNFRIVTKTVFLFPLMVLHGIGWYCKDIGWYFTVLYGTSANYRVVRLVISYGEKKHTHTIQWRTPYTLEPCFRLWLYKVPLTFLGGKSKFVIVPMHLVLACYALPASSTDSVLASPKRDACLELSVQSKSVVYVWHIAQIPIQVPSGQYRQ